MSLYEEAINTSQGRCGNQYGILALHIFIIRQSLKIAIAGVSCSIPSKAALVRVEGLSAETDIHGLKQRTRQGSVQVSQEHSVATLPLTPMCFSPGPSSLRARTGVLIL